MYTAYGLDSRTIRWDEPAPFGMPEIPEGIGLGPSHRGRKWMRPLGKHNYISVIASVDGGALHVSIACGSRYPTWDEILEVRAWAFDEDTEVVMVLARKSEYVNTHPNCFHLWESACGLEGR